VPIRALSLDLFDTVVDLHFEALGSAEVEGRRTHPTVALLHRALAEYARVDLEKLLEALRAADRELREPRYAEGRELPTFERMQRVAELLGLPDPGLPGLLTEAHMGAIRSVADAPVHHRGVLAALRRRAHLAICSNFTHARTARRILAEQGLAAHLDAVVISEDVGHRKPRAEIFAAVAEALGAAPHEILHAGDSLSADVAGAAAAGMRSAWVTRRVRDPGRVLSEWAGPPPDFVVAELAELEDLLGVRGPRERS
jgi:putative hydrolase of the HAD superfamily